jgi:RNA polymerase sigma factor (sigma-70 family)
MPTAAMMVPDADAALPADDVDSFYAAVGPHLEKMGRVAARLAGIDNRDDVVQDALLQAWRARAQFDPARGSLSAWLLAITAHQATKVRRRLALRLGSRGGQPRTIPDTDARIDLHASLRHLPPRERLALDCHYFADLSVAETAAVMRCSEGTVKSTLASAREHLRGLMR